MTFGLEFALAAALLGPAQQPTKSRDDPVVRQQYFKPTDIEALYEDIEIMRQLLGRKLRDLGGAEGRRAGYGTQQSSNVAQNGQPTSTVDATANLFLGTVNPFGTTANAATYSDVVNQYFHASASAAHVEGVYLERAGVVFTVTLPLSAGDPRPSPHKAAAAPAADEWEKARRQLRGEKSDATSPAPAQRPTVGDVILRALAENGKHFRRLDNDDRLTVVVTFHRHRTDRTAMNDYQSASAAAQNVGPPSPLTDRSARAAWLDATIAPATRDLELLADLHLKQQQYDQALEATRKAIAQLHKEMGNDGIATKGQVQQLASLYSRKAQALLATGKVDEAREALDRAAKAAQDTPGANVAQANRARPEGTSLPAKLIISARKDLLDAVGNGKMDYETFRKQVTAEYLTFGEEKQKPKP